MSRARNLAGFSSASTNAENPVNIRVGYVTAIAYYGDGSGLTGTPGGLGTALSDNVSSPLNKIYYTNANLSIASTIIVDPPQSASAAYTQYTDIVMQGDADLIVADGDTFIPDILGIGTFVDEPGVLSNGNGKVRADNYTDKLGSGAAYGPYGFVTPVGVAITVGSGTSISSPDTNVLTLGTNNLERLRITSTGLVGIGTTTPSASAKLHVIGDNSYIARFQRAQGGGFATIEIKSGNNTGNSRIYFADPDSVNVGQIDYEHNDDSMKFTTGGNEAARFNSSGNLAFPSGQGIDFSAAGNATGMTSELLDDYEEGTWTPEARDNFSAGNQGTFDLAVGYYTKIGNQVTAWGRFSNANTSGMNSTFDFCIAGLPFTASSNLTFTAGTIHTNFITFSGQIAPRIEAARTSFRIQECVSNANNDYVTVSQVASGTADAFFVVIYFI